MLKICLVLALVAARVIGQCESGWTPSGLSCYQIFTTLDIFDDHRKRCEFLGGRLVSIGGPAENNFVREELQRVDGCNRARCEMYIGLHSNFAGLFTSWLDGTPFGGGAYSNWMPGEPCVILLSDNGKRGGVPCNLSREAMCEKPQPRGWCENGWAPFGQCCYRMLTALQPFDVHQSDCQNRGGQLVSINSDEENTFVNLLQQAGCPIWSFCDAYIGLRRNSAGQFTSWLDGTPFGASYSNWKTGEPNNAGNVESCVEMSYAYAKWNDIACSSPRMAVCENCQPPTSTTTDKALDCRTVQTNVNCNAANGPAACDAQCRLFKYGQGVCNNFSTTSCPGYPLGSKGCLCNDALDCRTLRTQVNCAAANAAASCTNWCKLFTWTQGACTTFQSSWTCPGCAAGQAACLCQ